MPLRLDAGRYFCVVMGLQLCGFASLMAQQLGQWNARGDTTGAPSGCSAAAGIAAVTLFFTAFNNADSADLVRATSTRRPGGFVFSTGKFTATDAFARIESLPELVRYARRRKRRHERMTVQQVQFNR
jgi:hypothetical protein